MSGEKKAIIMQAGLEGVLSAAAMYIATPMVFPEIAGAIAATPLGDISAPIAAGIAVGASVALVDLMQLAAPEKYADIAASMSGYGKVAAAAAASLLVSYFMFNGQLGGVTNYAKFAGASAVAALLGDKVEDLVKDTKALGY